MQNKKKSKREKLKPISKAQKCEKCLKEFPSKNALFRHLRLNADKCLGEEEHEDYLASTLKYEKIVLLYGYIPCKDALGRRVGKEDKVNANELTDISITENKNELKPQFIRGGEDASLVLMNALQAMHSLKYKRKNQIEHFKQQNSINSINRSYGCVSRSNPIIAQDDFTGAISEVIACRAPPLVHKDNIESEGNEIKDSIPNSLNDAVKEWLEQINKILETKLLPDPKINGCMKVLGRLSVPSKFNAEFDVTHRRMEYLMPADFLFSNMNESFCQDLGSRQAIFNGLPSFQPGGHLRKKSIKANENEHLNKPSVITDPEQPYDNGRPAKKFLEFLYRVKKIMQKLTTQIEVLDENDEGAVLEKQFHDLKRQKNRQKHLEKQKSKKQRESDSRLSAENGKNNDVNTAKEYSPHKKKVRMDNVKHAKASDTTTKTKSKKNGKKQQHVLRRKRYHNFTPTVMAHDFLAFRRMDRFYHRSTLRFDNCELKIKGEKSGSRPFVVLSFTGDQFLLGQIRGVVGLFLAVIRGHIDESIIDCIFDEEYTSLVPAPFAPSRGLYYGSASYTSWEGKTNLILNPRQCNRYSKGWNDVNVLNNVEQWTRRLQQTIAESWFEEGVIHEDNMTGNRLGADKVWEEEVLIPWSQKACVLLKDYKKWKGSMSAKSNTLKNVQDMSALSGGCAKQNAVVESIDDSHVLDLVPSLDTVVPNAPKLYEKVLFCLREANKSGMWPKTTLKRQLVMSSTINEVPKDDDRDLNLDRRPVQSSLSMALMRAKKNKEKRASAYSFAEGQGGASGSFSVGGMPGKQCEQPKGNLLFPELMKAAFELEIALCPDREPSSTIAINRNAQFRPHTDNGAGAGQSTSLIVGLGLYSGGELMVEGERNDIRYRPIEFNGWTQRHWTLPFRGERYSLVWFTPKGCEGVHGIDLCT